MNKQVRVLIAIAAGCCALGARSQAHGPSVADGFSHVKTAGGIHEYTFDANGLQVLIAPDRSAPVVTFNLVYRVGSRNEVTGTTGATHMLEHLMFKGTDAFNVARGNGIDEYLAGVGASANATTSVDRTCYFTTVGSDALEGYVAIEADRMRNLWLRDSDRQAEMTVVRNEYEGGENQPMAALIKEVTAAAFQAQPYRHPTIGWKSDIENVPIEKLREFYDTFYWPNNATVVMVGDVEVASGLRLIAKYFGSIPRSPKPVPQMYTVEPEQTGARRIEVKRTGEVGTVIVVHKVPDGRNPDMAPLAVLDAILAYGKNSRLYRALVDTGVALNASSSADGRHDQSLHMLGATLAPGKTHEAAEQALLAEVERIKQDGVDARDVRSAIVQYQAADAYKRDGNKAVADGLTDAIAAGDWTLYLKDVEAIARVQPADVQRVARQYLNRDQSTTGWFIPQAPVAAASGVRP